MRLTSLLTVAALATFIATQAEAANEASPWQLGAYQPPTWQGVYFGVNGGGLWGHDDVSQSTTGGAPTGFNPSFDTEGGLVGFQGGYNMNLGPVVVGADADWDYSGGNGGYRFVVGGEGQDEKIEWLSTIRGRVGVPMGNLLAFATGGLALGDLKESYIGSGVTSDTSSVRTGWTAGGGLEYAMPENITFRLDYRYYNFGSYTETPSTVFPGSRYKQEPTLNSVTAGFSYNFW